MNTSSCFEERILQKLKARISLLPPLPHEENDSILHFDITEHKLEGNENIYQISGVN